MEKLYWLDQIKLQDRTLVGEKAFQLSRVLQRGYPVIPGFVVSAQVLQQFLETLNSSEPLFADLPHSSLHLDTDNSRQLQQVAARLRQEIINANLPAEWVNTIREAASQWQTACLIFRPSVAIPTATGKSVKVSGLLESQVCHCDDQAIARSLKQIWSQLYCAKSLLYWQRKGVGLQEINLAVLVQPLTNALASGLLNSDASGLEIQATWGLGVALAYGEVQPDVYQIQRATGAVQRHLGNKMIAYRLHSSAKPPASFKPVLTPLLGRFDKPCLQAYLLDLAQQQQYALKEEYLQELIQLVTQLYTDLGTTFALEWTISESKENEVPKLHLTQVSIPPFPISHPQEIKGLAAAAGRVMATAYVVNGQTQPESLPKGVILVAPAIAPDWLTLLQQAVGIVTEQGGLTSHGAILAREFGIPAVVNAQGATKLIQTGEQLLLDGDKGEIYQVSRGKEQASKGKEQVSKAEFKSARSSAPLPLDTSARLPMIATQLLVNLSQASLIEQVGNLPVDGVGLLRSELMVIPLLEGQHPHTWLTQGRQAELLERWQEQILQFARGFAPRPIFYRSLDWRSHEFPSFTDSLHPQQAIPMLGERGTFSYLRNPAVFDLELAALAGVQQAGYSNVHLILPFVRTVEEFSFCRRRVEQAGLHVQLWIMAEVPSVLLLLPEYIKAGVQGISIGTNDLTQLLLGVDRDQGELATAFNERHPAVMGAIAQLIKMARDGGIPCSICGQAPALYPEIIDQLVQWGITSISVEPEAVERTYQAIARAEQRILLEAARRQLH